MSRTFIEILDEIQEIHEELQNKVFDVICGDTIEYYPKGGEDK